MLRSFGIDYNWIEEYETRCRCSLYIFCVCIFSYVILSIESRSLGLDGRLARYSMEMLMEFMIESVFSNMITFCALNRRNMRRFLVLT